MQDHFPELPDNARVWIYQSDRAFTPAEQTQLNAAIADFVTQWSSHSRQVIAGGQLLHDRFVVLVADESAFSVSGCSIDSSVHFIKQLEKQYGVDFFNRMNLACQLGKTIQALDRITFQKHVDAGDITPDTLVFNNLVATKRDLLDKWMVPARDSWHFKLFFKAQA